MDTTEWGRKLESSAIKQAFNRAATTIPMFTKSASISTSKNAVTMVTPSSTTTINDQERVVITWNTLTGMNTIGTLEIAPNDNPSLPLIRRVAYTGGARWIINNHPDTSTGSWRPTPYSITVHSFVDGTLTLSEPTS